jgi:hypothetical protein
MIVPKDQDNLAAIWWFCSSDQYSQAVRCIDQNLKVTTATLAKVPFNLEHWQKVANELYPQGLPKPYSDDPTQWIFHGHPKTAKHPLLVAVVILLGYVWPAQIDDKMELSDNAKHWIALSKRLTPHVAPDGIACLPSVRGELPAHERLLKILIDAWETTQPDSWKPTVLDKLLIDADCPGKGLDTWLRDKFFEQHVVCFQHRPFIWHVWDGLKDGFAALVNYHKLDTKNLERLTHAYLGNWISGQENQVSKNIDGAKQRLIAAKDLQRRLELIFMNLVFLLTNPVA